MELEKGIMFKKIRPFLEQKYGREKAFRILKFANAELQELNASEPDADRSARTYVFPAVAIYRAVDHFAPGQALALTRSYGTETGIRMKKLFRRLSSIPGAGALIWKNMDKIASRMSEGYECKNRIVSEHLCSLDVTACPLYDKAKELRTPKAVQMICCMDKEYMQGFRGIDYSRTKSLAEGDDCCDYRIRDSRSRAKEGK